MAKKKTKTYTSDLHKYDSYFFTQKTQQFYPIFEPGKRYVYFMSLNDEGSSPAAKNLYKIVDARFKNGMNQITSSQENDTSKMDKALQFLQKAAEIERKKEEKFIEEFLNLYPNKIPNSVKNIENDFIKFITELNITIKNANEFKKQVLEEYMREQEQKELDQQINKKMKNITDASEKERTAIKNEIRGQAHHQAFFSNQNASVLSLFNLESKRGIITKIIIEQYGARLFTLQNDLKLNPEQVVALINVLNDKIDELIKINIPNYWEYRIKGNVNRENYEKTIINIVNDNEFKKYMDNIMDAPGLSLGLQSIVEQLGMDEPLKKIQRTNKSIEAYSQAIENSYTSITKIDSSSEIKDYTKFMSQMYAKAKIAKVQPYYVSEQKNLMELISNRLIGVLGGQKQPTTDIIVGRLFCPISIKEETRKQLQEGEKHFAELMNEAYKKVERTTTLNSFLNNTEALRAARIEQQQELIKLQKTATKMEEKAIELLSYVNLHDTIKGYTSSGQLERKYKGFSGASFGTNILDQLSILQSTVGNLLSIKDINWLLFALLNCGSQAIGGDSKNKTTLEDYFSGMIGYLMFNDAALMVEDVRNNIEYIKGGINDIHLYNINGVYIPNSFILQQTFNSLTKVKQDLTSVNNPGIRAKITTYNGGPINQENKNLEISDWQATSNAALDITKIEIHFLAGFFDILEKIAEAVEKNL